MAKVNLLVKMKSNTENNEKQLVGELNDNHICYRDLGYDININYKKDEIILTKQNKDYKITIKLQKNNNSCYYDDIKTDMRLILDISDEMISIEENDICFRYTLEKNNKVEYALRYEVADEE